MQRIKNLWLRLDHTGRIMVLMIPTILSGPATAILAQKFRLGYWSTLGVGIGFLAVIILVGFPLAFVPKVHKAVSSTKQGSE
jgi:hypothetical protein